MTGPIISEEVPGCPEENGSLEEGLCILGHMIAMVHLARQGKPEAALPGTEQSGRNQGIENDSGKGKYRKEIRKCRQ